jgi:hypothetical protein
MTDCKDDSALCSIEAYLYGVRIDRLLTSISRDFYTKTNRHDATHDPSSISLLHIKEEWDVDAEEIIPLKIFKGPFRIVELCHYIKTNLDYLKRYDRYLRSRPR